MLEKESSYDMPVCLGTLMTAVYVYLNYNVLLSSRL